MPNAPTADLWHTAVLNALRERYDLGGELHPLYGYTDLNYRLDGVDEERYIVKLMHSSTADADVKLQSDILQHCQNAHAPVSTVITAIDHSAYIKVEHQGQVRTLWVLQFLPGFLAADFQPIEVPSWRNLGSNIALLHQALRAFDHPHLDREFNWRLLNTDWLSTHSNSLDQLTTPARENVEQAINCVQQTDVKNALQRLPSQCIHGDLNEHNILLNLDGTLSGILDFGDAHRAPKIADIAIAAGYFMMQTDQPLIALGEIVSAYHETSPLEEDEQSLLLPLIRLRVAQSLVHAAQHLNNPELSEADREYRLVSLKPAQKLWQELEQYHDGFIAAWIRHSCGANQYNETWERIQQSLSTHPPAAMFRTDLNLAHRLELHPASGEPRDPFGGEMPDPLIALGIDVAIGGYGEPRMVYQASAFKNGAHATDPARTIHAGVDVFIAAGTPIYAPLDCVIQVIDNRTAEQDYGPVIVVRSTVNGDTFDMLLGHLDAQMLTRLHVGQSLKAGDLLAHVGAPPENGNWPPHLHLQCVLEDFGWGSDIDGVCHRWSWPLWQQLFPNPAALLGVSDDSVAHKLNNDESLLARREAVLGRNLSIAYNTPLQAVRGWQQYLFDQYGRCYLDAYNNVPHVGHGHPAVEAAITHQTRTLSTNTRYLHPTILNYAEKLSAHFPDPLNVVFLVNSASEANELALRLARGATDARDMLVIDDAYHGHTTSLIDISPYKAEGPGGSGCADWVHRVPAVDTYRGQFTGADAGEKYAQHVTTVIDEMRQQEQKLCAWIAESLPSVGGQLVFPEGYLANVYAQVRDFGGVCIADEVQTGFGRTGDYFWGFEQQNVIPDIVVLGKPIGNGYPLAAVVTSKEISDKFANGMEFFSTFGGNTVACAAGLAVLDVVEKENTQAHCKDVGDYLKTQLNKRIGTHPLIGDIRGLGLFLGIEMVSDRQDKTPATAAASHVKNRLREHGILIGSDGPFDNVLKIRPPTPFSKEDADHFTMTLSKILNDTVLQ